MAAGPLSTDEKITAFAFAVTISLWIFGAQIGVNAVAAALLGLSILLITGVVEWKENLAQVAAPSDEEPWIRRLLEACCCDDKFRHPLLYQTQWPGHPQPGHNFLSLYICLSWQLSSGSLAGCAATFVLRVQVVALQGASWETLSWFAALIAMATHLNKFGFIGWFSDKAGTPPPSTFSPSTVARPPNMPEVYITA